jgi:ferrous iron transport protein B
MSHHEGATESQSVNGNSKKQITVALAGNSNVGKSVIFNHLTGLHQHVGNWPGKTVERAEGTLRFGDYLIDVVDLPGIYSLSTFSIEEAIAMDYILHEKPDVIIDVVDASSLERNLHFTIQLLETEVPLIVSLNQLDVAIGKGISPDSRQLERLLGVPVVPMVAVRGVGFEELMREAIEIAENRASRKIVVPHYGVEVERSVQDIASLLSEKDIGIPRRYAAIKLLEGDEQVRELVRGVNQDAISKADQSSKELERIHGHPIETVISTERYALAYRIAEDCQEILPVSPRRGDEIDRLTTGGLSGYLIMALLLLSVFIAIFKTGDFISGVMGEFLLNLEPIAKSLAGFGAVGELMWAGVEGVIAGVVLAMPYILPFYVLIGLLEDSGYLARIAFMMDNVMHLVGLHGKAFIPLMLGYGCSVPGCLACKIMETERDKTIAIFLTTLIPCAARTVVIMGLVGRFVGLQWAAAIYVLDIVVILFLGRLIHKTLPGEPTGLIIEVPAYRMPNLKTVAQRAWYDMSSFIFVAFPLMIFGSIILRGVEIFGLLGPLDNLLSPITVGWLGLPPISGILLIFGVMRKELTLVMLAALSGTTDFASILTSNQMIVFAVVTMFYVPCLATIATLRKELGWRRTLLIASFEIVFSILLGGVIMRILT